MTLPPFESLPPTLQRGTNLAPFTSWVVGGRAEYFSLPKTIEEMKTVLQWAHRAQLPVTVLGGGSNVLISDQGINGLVLGLRRLSGVESITENKNRLEIVVLAGTAKSELLKIFIKNELAPALFLAGIPGDVGGGVVMNAGVGEQITPREFVEIVDWIEVLDLSGTNIKRFNKNDLVWSYRHCKGWEPGIITRVGISWPNEKQAGLLQQVKAANQVRLSKQPLHLPSCGSVFVNPPGQKAGQLIDECGLRGFQIGDAQVSEKHANFIVNTDAATATDIDRVIKHVQTQVKLKTGVQLNTEVRYLGSWSLQSSSGASV